MQRQDSQRLYRAIGLMSGTSLDGVDAALIETDGEGRVRLLAEAYVPFDAEFHALLAALATGDLPLTEVLRAERRLMQHYVLAVEGLKTDLSAVDVIGGHGQTIRHLPTEGLTWQLGDASYLSEKTGVPAVMDFRRRDMAAGGQGAPFAPLYHRAVLGDAARPCGVLNIGGVANLTWFDAAGGIVASDTGPGVGLVDKLVRARTGAPFDRDGALALAGRADAALVGRALAELAYWKRPWPRSADRYEFDEVLEWLAETSIEDACATLAALTAAGIRRSMEAWEAAGPVYVCGGGARNQGILAALEVAGVDARSGDQAGLRTQTMEAECFAWLAVRRLRGLHTSEPATTGAGHVTVGGVLTYAAGR